MKKFISIIVIMIIAICLVGCNNDDIDDNVKFKDEYESINDLETGYGDYKNLHVSIPKNNNIVYKTDKEIIDVIKNETAVVYFGFNTCPWCRSMVENLIKVTTDLYIDNVYYVDVKNIRNTMTISDTGVVTNVTNGTDAYNELLDLLHDYLNDYVLSDKNGNSVNTGFKRIYAPNVIVVSEGKVLGLTSGASDKLENPYKELSDELKQDSYVKLYNLISKISSNKVCIENGNC